MNDFSYKGWKVSFEKASEFSSFRNFLQANIGYFKSLPKAKKIIIKINIPFWETPEGSSTKKDSLIALIAFLKNLSYLPIQVVESRYGFIPTKVKDMYGDLGVEVVDLFERPHHSFWATSIDGRPLNLFLSTEALNSKNFIVTLGPPKTHEFVIYTGAVKTLMGFLRMKKRHMHGFSDVRLYKSEGVWERQVRCLHRNLVDLQGLIPVDVSLLDGTSCMEGEGPVYGNHVHWDYWAISNDPPSLDYMTSFFMGMEPMYIAYLWRIFQEKESLRNALDYFLDENWNFYQRDFKRHPSYEVQEKVSRALIEEWEEEKGGEVAGKVRTGGKNQL